MTSKKTTKTRTQRKKTAKIDKAEKTTEPKPVQETKPKKLSALDAAAKILQETGTSLNCQELIDVMAAKGYWTSPAGKTPSATLYSSLLREIQAKGKQSRFIKTERGKFAAAPTQQKG